MTAVLALMAVLTGTAVVLLAGPRGRAAAADAVGQVAFADLQTRQAAVAADRPQALVIDLADGRLSRSPLALTDATAGATLADLPAGVRVTRVLTAGEAVDYGQVRVAVSAAGRSASYAVGLSTAAGPRWLVVAGLTGQATPVPDEAAADAALAPTRGGE